jgi:hypothetical protein
MASQESNKKMNDAKEWLLARKDVAEAADRWAKEYVVTHELSRPEDIIDALAEAFEAGAAAMQTLSGQSRSDP